MPTARKYWQIFYDKHFWLQGRISVGNKNRSRQRKEPNVSKTKNELNKYKLTTIGKEICFNRQGYERLSEKE